MDVQHFENYLFLKINNENLQLSLAESTYKDLTANPSDLIPQYVKLLKQNQLLEVETIWQLSFSLDNEDFCEIEVSSSEVSEEHHNDEGKQKHDQETAWGEQGTKYLLDKYETYLPQCENRYKTILKRKKITINHNNRTGESPRTDPYEKELSRIAAIDDSIEPPVRMGVGKSIIMNSSNKHMEPAMSSCSSGSSTPSCSRSSTPSCSRSSTPSCSSKGAGIRKRSLREVLIDIGKEKEEGRNRRHKEKLDFLRQLTEKLFEDRTISVDDGILEGKCTCPRGQVICHHIAAVCIHAHHNISVTDQVCTWNAPKTTSSEGVETLKTLFPLGRNYD
ncbi:hypothetical protein FQA39_LY00259 [Lamprigera yunnana]|nr:hypothetical protein FQA39_LY00259 [Lamprigera yunnana]